MTTMDELGLLRRTVELTVTLWTRPYTKDTDW